MKLEQLVPVIGVFSGLLLAPMLSLAALDDVSEYSNAADLPRSLIPNFATMPKETAELNEGSDWVLPTVDESGKTETAALEWLQNELQMSIDSSIAPQVFVPDFTCMEPPYNCPANVKCPLSGAGNAICVVTSCGTGACSTCPNFFGNSVILSWCAYGCMKGKDVVGGAYGFWVRFLGWRGPMCFPG